MPSMTVKSKASIPTAKGAMGQGRQTAYVRHAVAWDGFDNAYRASVRERIGIVKAGVHASDVEMLARYMEMPKEQVTKWLGLSTATVNRKVREHKRLSPDETSKVLGMQSLVGQVQAMVDESGDPAGFDAAKWMARWIDEPLPALGGSKPAEFLDTSEGQSLVASLLARMQSGAYS